MKINILGTEYTMTIKEPGTDKKLENCDGYCDWTTKTISVLNPKPDENSVADMEVYKKKVMRHEITHAFLLESGLAQCTNQSADGGGAYDEQVVDWFAMQGPKIYAAWKEADAL